MKTLTAVYYGVWLTPVLIQVLVMLGLPVQGILATNPQAQYICSFISVVFTLAFIYLALKMIAFSKVADSIYREGLPAYFRFALIRMSLLHGLSIINLLFYHFTLQSSCGFCWLITMFALCFIKPGKKEFERLTA